MIGEGGIIKLRMAAVRFEGDVPAGEFYDLPEHSVVSDWFIAEPSVVRGALKLLETTEGVSSEAVLRTIANLNSYLKVDKSSDIPETAAVSLPLAVVAAIGDAGLHQVIYVTKSDGETAA